mgnify:CR=1 FL=1
MRRTTSESSDPRGLLPLTPVEFHILLSLSDDPRHGYAILQEIERRSDGRLSPHAGTLYRALARLVEDRLLEEPEHGVAFLLIELSEVLDEDGDPAAAKGELLRGGTIVDATLIAASPSTKNETQKRDPAALLPGTLDLLILKAVSLGKLHGYGVLLHRPAPKLQDFGRVRQALAAEAAGQRVRLQQGFSAHGRPPVNASSASGTPSATRRRTSAMILGLVEMSRALRAVSTCTLAVRSLSRVLSEADTFFGGIRAICEMTFSTSLTWMIFLRLLAACRR